MTSEYFAEQLRRNTGDFLEELVGEALAPVSSAGRDRDQVRVQA
jgi:hypothetical protein